MSTSLRFSLKTTLLIVLAALAASCEGQKPGSNSTSTSSTQNQMKSQDEAARKALETLPAMVTAENFSGMGFSSVEEARTATLGTPVPLRTVGYNKLLEYKAGTPLEQLFDKPEQVIYPVMVGQAVRTSIVVAQQGDGWRIGSVGDRYLGSLLGGGGQRGEPPPANANTTGNTTANANAQVNANTNPNADANANRTANTNANPNASSSPAPGAPSGKVEVISIPGISFDLVSSGEGDQRMLTPVNDLPEAQLFRGRAVRAQDALAALSNYAKEFDRKFGEEIRKRRLVK